MKILVLVVFCTISISDLAAQNLHKKNLKESKEQQAYIDALIKIKINNLLRDRTFVFYPTYMFPRGKGSVAMGYDYFVKVEQDTVVSYLPFWGTTYVIKSGIENSGYDFSEKLEDYKMGRVRKGYRVSFDINNGSNLFIFTFHISYLGATTLTIGSSKRQSMSYVGTIGEFKEEKIPTF